MNCPYCNQPGHNEDAESCPRRREDAERFQACAEYGFLVPWNKSPDAPSSRQVGGDHYKGFAIQPGHFCQVNRIPYCEANAIKYVCRHRLKGGRGDIEKAIHYLQLLLEWEYSEKGDPKP